MKKKNRTELKLERFGNYYCLCRYVFVHNTQMQCTTSAKFLTLLINNFAYLHLAYIYISISKD